jgi:hypothetical protein
MPPVYFDPGFLSQFGFWWAETARIAIKYSASHRLTDFRV